MSLICVKCLQCVFLPCVYILQCPMYCVYFVSFILQACLECLVCVVYMASTFCSVKCLLSLVSLNFTVFTFQCAFCVSDLVFSVHNVVSTLCLYFSAKGLLLVVFAFYLLFLVFKCVEFSICLFTWRLCFATFGVNKVC